MARMPETTCEFVGEAGSRPMTQHDIVCIHTIVGRAPASAAHFSTFGSGRLVQSRDTKYQSAANLNGNHRVIAIENEDMGDAFDGMPRGREGIPALTAGQIEACAQVLAWAHKTHGVPLQLCPDSRPGSKGLAYHRQGIDGNFGGYKYPGRVSGGEVWTEHFGKVCPTDLRIAQLPLILARAKQIVSGKKELTMDQDVKKAFAEIKSEVAGMREDLATFRKNTNERDRRNTKRVVDLVKSRFNATDEDLAEIQKAMEA